MTRICLKNYKFERNLKKNAQEASHVSFNIVIFGTAMRNTPVVYYSHCWNERGIPL
jgi:hypothetical protein